MSGLRKWCLDIWESNVLVFLSIVLGKVDGIFSSKLCLAIYNIGLIKWKNWQNSGVRILIGRVWLN
jgi:hypothetical protein